MQALASTHTILQAYYRMTPVRGSRAVSYRENVRESSSAGTSLPLVADQQRARIPDKNKTPEFLST